MPQLFNPHELVQPVPSFIHPFPLEMVTQELNEGLEYLELPPDKSDLGVKLKDVFLYVLYKYYVLRAQVFKNHFLDYSEGPYLDELVRLFGITRKQDIPPLATAKLYSKVPMQLPKGEAFIASTGDIVFLMVDSLILPEGSEVLFQSEKEGAIVPVRPFNDNGAIVKIEMLGEFKKISEGETDEQLRERAKLALVKPSTAGAREAYDFHVKSVEGVKEARSYNNGPGKVLIVFDGRADLIPLIKSRVSVLSPITDDIEVKKAEEIELNMTLTITYLKEADINAIQLEITSVLEKVASSLRIGQKIDLSKLYAYVTNHKDVDSSEIDDDTLNKIKNVGRDQILKLNRITYVTKFLR